MTLQSFFYPHSVAVAGSASEGKLGFFLIKQLLEGGFSKVYAINPKGKGAFSVPGFREAREIGEEVDLVVIASPAPTVKEVLEDCGKSGIKSAVIISAGFSEIGNWKEEQKLLQIARKFSMRLIGPNCAGIVNTHHRLFATLETRPPSGCTAFISQSGALGGAVLSWAEEQGLGFSKFVSYGNGIDIDDVELLDYLADDPETKVVALYLETARKGRELLRAIRNVSRKKPLVLIKSGKSQAGKRATLSHTGSLAGSDEVFDCALKDTGAIRVEGIEEMFDLCRGFSLLPPVTGKKVLIVTNSGGPGVLTTDKAEEMGLEVAEPSAPLKEKFRRFLTPRCSLKNPVDFTVEGTEEDFQRTLALGLKGDDGDGEYNSAIAINVGTPFLDSVSLARGIASGAKETGKPVLASFLAGKIVEEGIRFLKENGIPNFQTGERAAKVISLMHQYHINKEKIKDLPPSPEPLRRKRGFKFPQTEPEVFQFLKDLRLPVPDFRFAETEPQAMKFAGEVGFPLVMKLVSHSVVHKSEVGGVVLNIQDLKGVQESFQKLKEKVPPGDFLGVTMFPMISALFEALVGVYRDPQFGPVIAFGMGGIYTEILKDVSLRLAPLDEEGAGFLIEETKFSKILKGARGKKGCDLESLVDLLVKVSRMPFLFQEIGEMDLNPVFLLEKGVLIGDARIIQIPGGKK
ncbi:MAG: acetate--CoA ligase family protein [Caldiserica bacterium]|jgi:acetyltransferase|nr:acetate--CoA ligase family protein [Caldisericota bacterium]MDH7562281.1 acetate--CoA ligase family protein [Caldisericota bacterium]